MKVTEEQLLLTKKRFTLTLAEVEQALIQSCKDRLPPGAEHGPIEIDFRFKEGEVVGATLVFRHEGPMPLKEQGGDLLKRSVEELEISVRAANCLYGSNIKTIGDLTSRTEREMQLMKNMGKRTLNELKDVLASVGLSFKQEQKVTKNNE